MGIIFTIDETEAQTYLLYRVSAESRQRQHVFHGHEALFGGDEAALEEVMTKNLEPSALAFTYCTLPRFGTWA